MSQGCDGILSALTDKLDKETINLLPESVKILSNFAVGFGNIDLEAAKKRNIAVTNTPEVLTDATAEIGILLILGACRRASEGIEGARAGDWKWSADYLIGKQLTGSRLRSTTPGRGSTTHPRSALNGSTSRASTSASGTPAGTAMPSSISTDAASSAPREPRWSSS